MGQVQGQAKKSGQQIRLRVRIRKVQGWVKVYLHSSSHRDQERLPSTPEGEKKKKQRKKEKRNEQRKKEKTSS